MDHAADLQEDLPQNNVAARRLRRFLTDGINSAGKLQPDCHRTYQIGPFEEQNSTAKGAKKTCSYELKKYEGERKLRIVFAKSDS